MKLNIHFFAFRSMCTRRQKTNWLVYLKPCGLGRYRNLKDEYYLSWNLRRPLSNVTLGWIRDDRPDMLFNSVKD